MRDFTNWEILQRIENSPKEFIVQRKVSLLDAFLFGYEILLQPETEERLKEEYKDVPSIDEYAIEKYSAKGIGTRNFKSIISFTSEDERDFFYKYLDFLKEYEQKYPIKERISYTLRETPLFIFEELLLKGMRKRYPMYFGDYDISKLRSFLDGYFLCKKEYDIPLTAFETKIRKFTESIICEDLNLSGKFVTWDRLYRYDRDWYAWGEIDDSNAKKILENFWSDLEKFTEETIE